MKNSVIYLFILFLFTNALTAQDKSIRVNYVLEYGIVKNNESLIADGKSALYSNDPLILDNKNNVKSNADELKFEVNQKTIKLDKIETFSTYDSPVIYQIQYKDNNSRIVIEDTMPEFNWVIQGDEKKTIGNFQCIKATCVFRGTKITAYFTEDLPFSAGPWKFGKLPGLILEVFTEDSALKYHWHAVDIKYPFEHKNVIGFNKSENKDLISMKEYMAKRDIEIRERNEIIDSRKPQGVSLQKSTTTRLGIEKVFEWEK